MSRSGSTVTIAVATRGGVVAEVGERDLEVAQRRRAHVGAVRVAEVDDQQAARRRPDRERRAAVGHVGQRRAVDLRLGVAGQADELVVVAAAAPGGRQHGDRGDGGEQLPHPDCVRDTM